MKKSNKHPSDIKSISLIIPVLILVGGYLIISDPVSPGGGFQGGALLAAVLISHYLIMPKDKINTKSLENLEKIIFLVFVVSVTLYIIAGLHWDFPQWYGAYLIIMNVLLGVKVFCGLSIMFLYFVLEEH